MREPSKRLCFGLGSRLAASRRSPTALVHPPSTLDSPASPATTKDRDSAGLTEPDTVAKSGAAATAGAAAAAEKNFDLLGSLGHRGPIAAIVPAQIADTGPD